MIKYEANYLKIRIFIENISDPILYYNDIIILYTTLEKTLEKVYAYL